VAEHDSGQERTERPTPKRLEDARRKGQVLRSRELNTLLSMLGVSAVVYFLGAGVGAGLVEETRRLLSVERALAHDQALAYARLAEAFERAIRLQLPLFAAMAAASFLGPAVLGGIGASAEAVAFKPERLDPVKGLGRLFGPNALAEAAKALLKLAWLGLVSVAVGRLIAPEVLALGQLPAGAGVAQGAALLKLAWLGLVSVAVGRLIAPEVLALGQLPAGAGVAQGLSLLAFVLLALSAALVPIAAIDAPHQAWRHLQQLRMTRQEVKDELKETDGNPEMKSRLRQQQRTLAQGRMMHEVPDADVVITNPTHFAVALRYDPRGQGAPTVIAKGVDRVAVHIRELALAHGVPLFEAAPLARALHASTELGQSIPAGLYVAVARVLAYVYQLRAARHRPYEAPPPPADLPVPEEFLSPHAGHGGTRRTS